MFSRNWQKVYEVLGSHLFKWFYTNYLIFLKTMDDALVQIAGKSIFTFLSGCKVEKLPGKKCDKFNLKEEDDTFANNKPRFYWDEFVNRNRLFYSIHMNRKNHFFSRWLAESKLDDQEKATQELFKKIFEFTRMRPHLKSEAMRHCKHILACHRTLDYNHVLSKNCPLPENWKYNKKNLVKLASFKYENGRHRK